MATGYKNPRGTRAALNAKASGGTIEPGQVYVLTDEARLAVGLTTTTYQTFLKEGEGSGGGAPLNSPAFTGTPTAPTAAPGTNTTQIATTSFVAAAVAVGGGGGGSAAVAGFVVPFTGTGTTQNVTIPSTSAATDLLVFFGAARQLSGSYTVSGTTVTVTAPLNVACEIVKVPGFKGDTGATGTNGTNGTVDTIGEYTNGANPTSPTGGLKIFARRNSGRNRLAYIGPAGIDVSVQAFLGANKIGYWGAQGNSNTAFNSAAPGIMLFNFGHTATGTATTRTVATTNLFTSTRRMGFASAATAGASAGTRYGATQFWRGNAAGLGGFEYVARFGLSAVNATSRFFVGLTNSANVLANSDPIGIAGYIGVGSNSGQTTMRVTSGTTSVDLGANFPVNTQNADVYELRIFVAPNAAATAMNWSVTRLNTGHYAEGTFDSATVPSNTTLLSPQIWINNGSTASAVAVDVISQYIETDT